MRPKGLKNGDQTRKALAFIKAEFAATGKMPKPSAISNHMGWNNVSSARDCMMRLVVWGELERDWHAPPGNQFRLKAVAEEVA